MTLSTMKKSAYWPRLTEVGPDRDVGRAACGAETVRLVDPGGKRGVRAGRGAVRKGQRIERHFLVVPSLRADQVQGDLLRPLKVGAGGRRTGESLGPGPRQQTDVAEERRVGRRALHRELSDLQRGPGRGRAVAASAKTGVKVRNGCVDGPVRGQDVLSSCSQRRIVIHVEGRILCAEFGDG